MTGKVVLAVGGVLVIGAVGYLVYKYLQDSNNDNSNDERKTIADDKYTVAKDTTTTSNVDFLSAKNRTVNSMKDRHAEASHIIADSIQNIQKNEDEFADAEVNEKIDQDLDALLK